MAKREKINNFILFHRYFVDVDGVVVVVIVAHLIAVYYSLCIMREPAYNAL